MQSHLINIRATTTMIITTLLSALARNILSIIKQINKADLLQKSNRIFKYVAFSTTGILSNQCDRSIQQATSRIPVRALALAGGSQQTTIPCSGTCSYRYSDSGSSVRGTMLGWPGCWGTSVEEERCS